MPEEQPRISDLAMRPVLLAAAALLLASGAVLAFRDQASAAMTTYGAAGMCLLFAFLPHFKRFKAMGIEAEMRGTIKEARDVIDRMRRISLPSAKMTFSMLARMGRLGVGSPPRRVAHEAMLQIETELRGMEATPQEIEAAKDDWHRHNMFDISCPLLDAIRKLLARRVEAKQNELTRAERTIRAATDENDRLVRELNEIRDQHTAANRLRRPPSNYRTSPDEILQLLHNCPVLTEDDRAQIRREQAEVIADMKYYAERGEFRRPEVWCADDPHKDW